MMKELQELAHFVAASRLAHVAEPMQDEAVRALVDWLGCCLGGCLDPALDAVDGVVGSPDELQATLPGRGSRGPATTIALKSAIAADVLDFAPMHAAAEASVSVPIAAALLALAEAGCATGADLLHAYVLGSEIACRLAPAQRGSNDCERETFDRCAAFGAALACGKLLGLDASRLVHAACISAAQAPIGSAPRNGYSGVAFAAREGLHAALRARHDTSAATAAYAHANGSAASILAGRLSANSTVLDGLGEEWRLARTAYKPYPCASALHGTIEACLAVRARVRPPARQIARVQLCVHPAVRERVDAPAPKERAQAQRSIQHAAAVALVDGTVGIEQFDARRVMSVRVGEMRARIEVVADGNVPPEGARVVLHLVDGRSTEQVVRCARGSPARPLSDAELSTKFRDLAAEVLATDQAERALALAWNVRALGDVGALVRAAVPEDELEPAELPGSPLIPR